MAAAEPRQTGAGADVIVPTDRREGPRRAGPWLVLALVCLGQFMVGFDRTVVNVALPSIQDDLGFATGHLPWVANAYFLTFGGFLMLGGRAADRFGRRRVYVLGIALFSVASLLCGVAGSQELLVAARAVQGLGAALISPAALAILMTTFADGPGRTRAVGIWVGVEAGAGASGLALGGLLVSLLSWPWIFIINLPVGIVVGCLAVAKIAEMRPDHPPRSFDLLGAVTVTAGLVLLVLAITQAGEAGWWSATTLGAALAAVAMLVAFVFIEGRRAEPLFRFGILRQRALAAANVTTVLMDGALTAMAFFLALYLQDALGASALETGLAFLPLPIFVILSTAGAQVLVRRIGIKSTALLGLAMIALGLLMLTRINGHGDYLADVLPALVVIAIGMGFAFTPQTLLATGNIGSADVGLASGIFHTSQQVGSAIGLALIAAFASSRIGTGVDGYRLAFFLAAAMAFLAAIPMLLLRSEPRPSSDGSS